MNKIKEKNFANMQWLMNQELDVKSTMMTNYLELCRIVANSFMDQEVEHYTGPRYKHQGQTRKYTRWGSNPGSVQIGSQRIPVEVPRIRDTKGQKHVSLKSYQKMKKSEAADEQAVRSVLHGLSTRDYGKVAYQLQDSFGLSSSKLSREFVKYSAQALKEFEERRLDEHDIIAVFIDGKHMAAEQIIIALGITSGGKKIPLGVVQCASENSLSLQSFLNELIERGLCYKNGLLFIIDGSKGIFKGIKDAFGKYAVIQRCQWHKRENIISYLSPMHQQHYRKRLQDAYRAENYHKAKAKLMIIYRELQKINRAAAKSLAEGLEETLTLHRLELNDHLSTSFGTTNCIESVNSLIGKYIRKVKRWTETDQRYRWVVAGLIEIEKNFRKVKGYKHLPLLKKKLLEVVHSNKKIQNAA